MGDGRGCWGEVGDGGQAGLGGLAEGAVDVRGAEGVGLFEQVGGCLEGRVREDGHELSEGQPVLVAEVQGGVGRLGDVAEEGVDEVAEPIGGEAGDGLGGCGRRGRCVVCDHAGIFADRRGGVGWKVWMTTKQRTDPVTRGYFLRGRGRLAEYAPHRCS